MQSIEQLIEKINGVYRDLMDRKININDIEVFYESLCTLSDLKQKYNQKFSNRHTLGNQISDLASNLLPLVDEIYNQVKFDVDNYKSRDNLFITDFEKIIFVLFNAQKSLDFSLKKIYVSRLVSFKIGNSTREFDIEGVVYLIGDSTILAEIDDKKIYWESDVRKLTTRLLESGKSLIIGSNYYYDTNLLPLSESLPLNIKGKVSINCYLKNDVLNEVVYRLLAYAETNGNHINDIPENEILNNISVAPINIKKLERLQ